MMRKPGLGIVIAVGHPRPGAGGPLPPRYKTPGQPLPDNPAGGPPTTPGGSQGEPDADDQAGQAGQRSAAGGSASPSEVGFHDGSEVCVNCAHYDTDTNGCVRWGFAVGDNPQGAYCHAFKAGQPQGSVAGNGASSLGLTREPSQGDMPNAPGTGGV